MVVTEKLASKVIPSNLMRYFENGKPEQLSIFFEHHTEMDSYDVNNPNVVETGKNNNDVDARNPHHEFQQNSDGTVSNDESHIESGGHNIPLLQDSS